MRTRLGQRKAAVGVWLVLSVMAFLWVGQAGAADKNPVDAAVTVFYKTNSGSYTWCADRWFYDRYYYPWLDDYCSHKTTSGSSFVHGHFADGFDFNDPVTGEAVTAAKVDQWGDSYYSGYTRCSNATCYYNCHAYATGWNSVPIWLADVLTVLNDTQDWEDCTAPEVNSVDTCTSHSVKVVDICESSCYAMRSQKVIREKNGATGIYELTFSCPGGGSSPKLTSHSLYKPK